MYACIIVLKTVVYRTTLQKTKHYTKALTWNCVFLQYNIIACELYHNYLCSQLTQVILYCLTDVLIKCSISYCHYGDGCVKLLRSACVDMLTVRLYPLTFHVR